MTMYTTKYLIIGNSAAAINAVEGIRTFDKNGEILIVSDESCHTYSRPLITYYLGAKIGKEMLSYRSPSFYEEKRVRTLLGNEALSLDTKKKQVTLKDGTGIGFEKLLISTGGTPIVPPIPGKELEGIFTFTTLDDAFRVKRFIEEHEVKKAVVVGGGLIGLKVTEALIALNIQVTIVELADRILSATFDQTASEVIRKALQDIGCSTITLTTVKEFQGGAKRRIAGALLQDGQKIECDLAFIAIGVKPRVDLVKGTEIRIDRGIIVDQFLSTNIGDIYAAGDVIEAYDFIAQARRPVAILPNASRQGRIAGINMAGGNRKYAGCVAMNALELAGIPTISVGLTDQSNLQDEKRRRDIEALQDYERERHIYKKIILEKNKIIGTIFVGAIERAGIYTGLLQDRVDISPFKDLLLKSDFGLISLPREYRKHLVTGVGIEV